MVAESSKFPYDVLSSLSIFLNLPLDLLHFNENSSRFDDLATQDHHLQLEALIEQAHSNLNNNLGVLVRRGIPVVESSVAGSTQAHPTFETLIQYSLNSPVYIASRRFEAYRKLFRDLYRGITAYLFFKVL